jgi:hypothetical protein
VDVAGIMTIRIVMVKALWMKSQFKKSLPNIVLTIMSTMTIPQAIAKILKIRILAIIQTIVERPIVSL